jgi:hypothetical protein
LCTQRATGCPDSDRSPLDLFGRSYALEGKNLNSPAGDTNWKLAASPPDAGDLTVHESEAISSPFDLTYEQEVEEVTVVWLPSSSPRRTQLLA